MPRPSRRLLIALSILVLGGGLMAVWRSSRTGKLRQPLPTTVVSRGTIVVTVGGLGKVVDAGAGTRAVAIGGTGGSSGGSPPSAGSGGASAAVASATTSSRPVYPKVGGRIVRVLIAPGERVKPGQMLARLDASSARAQTWSRPRRRSTRRTRSSRPAGQGSRPSRWRAPRRR